MLSPRSEKPWAAVLLITVGELGIKRCLNYYFKSLSKEWEWTGDRRMGCMYS
jgi:hypothetical protein